MFQILFYVIFVRENFHFLSLFLCFCFFLTSVIMSQSIFITGNMGHQYNDFFFQQHSALIIE